MIRIGVTGGIGSGKSTVCRIMEECGAAVYDSDANAKRLMAEDAEVRRQLASEFGDETFAGGTLNRSYLASVVFADGERLQRLNAIVHPAVRADFRRWCCERTEDLVVLESAILFESGFDSEVDRVVAVVAPGELRIERVMLRNGVTREEVERRMAAQMSDDELHARADHTIANISLDYLRSDVEQLCKILRYESRVADIRH